MVLDGGDLRILVLSFPNLVVLLVVHRRDRLRIVLSLHIIHALTKLSDQKRKNR